MIVPPPRSTNLRCGRLGKPAKGHDVQHDHRIHLGRVGLQQRCGGADTGIVDKHGDARIGTQDVFDARNAFFAAEIRSNDLDCPSGFRRQA